MTVSTLWPWLLTASGGDAVAHRKLSGKATGAGFGGQSLAISLLFHLLKQMSQRGPQLGPITYVIQTGMLIAYQPGPHPPSASGEVGWGYGGLRYPMSTAGPWLEAHLRAKCYGVQVPGMTG